MTQGQQGLALPPNRAVGKRAPSLLSKTHVPLHLWDWVHGRGGYRAGARRLGTGLGVSWVPGPYVSMSTCHPAPRRPLNPP